METKDIFNATSNVSKTDTEEDVKQGLLHKDQDNVKSEGKTWNRG